MSIAARVAGWQLKLGGQAGPYSVESASGVTSNQVVRVELLIDGIWQDITGYVLVRESGNISIRRGQSSEGSAPDPGSCDLQLNNRDGRFSTLNPTSPYYGKIGLNTQIRVSVPSGDDPNYRFWGEVSNWPEDWDQTDTDVWVSVSASGILQRLRQNTTPLRSSLFRGVTSAQPASGLVAYWPCEDGSDATSLASGMGGNPMTFVGSPSLSQDTGFSCSDSLPVMNNAEFLGSIGPYTLTGNSMVRFLLYLPTAPTNGTVLLDVSDSGTVARWQVQYTTGGNLTLRGVAGDGTVLVTSGALAYGVDGKRLQIQFSLSKNGSGVDWILYTTSAVDGFTLSSSGTFASVTMATFKTVRVDPSKNLSDSVFGHIYVQSVITPVSDITSALVAHNGEEVDARFDRLCREQSIDAAFTALSSDTMGPQRPGQFLNLLQECIDVNSGILFERETAFGIAFAPREALYNSIPRFTLAYDQGHLSDVPRPVPDAKLVQNIVTVSRPNGSSATAELTSGPLSTQPPPSGVGEYSDAVTLNMFSDDDLLDHASWRLHLGTVNEPRYPSISVNLARSEISGSLRFDILHTIFSQKITVTGLPSRLGEDLSLIVIGMQETLTLFEHRISFVCIPHSPYEVARLDDSAHDHAGTDGSTLAQDMTPTSTTVQIATTDPTTGVWTTAAGDFPFDVTVAGEQMTVTNITGASSPQTFTVTRSVNGVVKTHQVGEDVRLTSPMVLAL